VQKCKFTIWTTADNQTSVFEGEGEMSLAREEVRVCYREKNAFVRLLVQGESAQIFREGDYSLHLDLKRGETRNGALGLGEGQGLIQAFTHKINYSVSKDSLLLLLEYDLLFGEEKQEMKLRLLSRLR
jgi:uncharacterized beta-barrel protein YwiB (DUF1934 family)